MRKKAVLVSLAVALFAASAAAASSRELERSIPATGVQSLAIHAAVGDLKIEPAKDDAIHVKVRLTPRKGGLFSSLRSSQNEVDAAKLKVKRSGNKLKIEIATGTEKPRFEATWSVELPARLDLRLRLGVGDIEVSGSEGALYVRDGVGDVDVTADASWINVEVGVGDVSIRGSVAHFGEIKGTTGVGDAQLEIPGRTLNGRGMVSKTLSWKGDGPGAMNLTTGVGDLQVSLR